MPLPLGILFVETAFHYWESVVQTPLAIEEDIALSFVCGVFRGCDGHNFDCIVRAPMYFVVERKPSG